MIKSKPNEPLICEKCGSKNIDGEYGMYHCLDCGNNGFYTYPYLWTRDIQEGEKMSSDKKNNWPEAAIIIVFLICITILLLAW